MPGLRLFREIIFPLILWISVQSTMENLAPYDLLIAPHDAVLTENRLPFWSRPFPKENVDPQRQNRLQG